MKMDYDCLNCTFSYGFELISKIKNSNGFADDELFNKYKELLVDTLLQVDYSTDSSDFLKIFYDVFFKIFGEKDYFETEKTNANSLFMEIYDDLLDFCMSSEDPLYSAFKLSLLGELFSHNSENSFGELEIEIQSFFRNKEISMNDYESFKKDLENTKFLLFIHNYAGEIVFDKVFIKIIKEFKPDIIIHSALKSKPIYKCATSKDSEEIFLKEVSLPFESGSKYIGTHLELTNNTFKNIFDKADIIIAKGQHNFESLYQENLNKPVYFSFIVDCKSISNFFEVNKGALIFKKIENFAKLKNSF